MSATPVQLSDFSYQLPPELIATHPVEPRDHCRLMVIDRNTGDIEHAIFQDLAKWITPQDLLILNDTRVMHARLHAEGGKVEVLLTQPDGNHRWKAIGKPGKKLKVGRSFQLDDALGNPTTKTVTVMEELAGGQRLVELSEDADIEKLGQLALPPYIQKERQTREEHSYTTDDETDYQTVYARSEDEEDAPSVAAPTAGLHFTPELLKHFNHASLQLQVGLGTFRPIKVDDVTTHDMHREHFTIPVGLKEKAESAKRVVSVGTTTCRVLESQPDLKPMSDSTDIFIYPGHEFKRTDALITNFHLPDSTLILLVAAMMGKELQQEAYQKAVEEKYRFFSYGDAMLIL